jgi:hypothetical protein
VNEDVNAERKFQYELPRKKILACGHIYFSSLFFAVSCPTWLELMQRAE